ncbi:MAG: hypothetical protein QOI99_779 [Actinomycetota bacterium]|nr:hypothetical protein [Actinomycetota bacterium]
MDLQATQHSPTGLALRVVCHAVQDSCRRSSVLLDRAGMTCAVSSLDRSPGVADPTDLPELQEFSLIRIVIA